jgi:Rod binding domain-containing protein
MTNTASSIASLSPQLSTPAAEPGRGKKAAQDFEAHLIGSLLEALEKTFSSVPGGESTPGADDYNYLGTEALAGALAAKGGFGIAGMISKYMAAHESTDGSYVTKATVSPKASPTPADRTR